MIVYEYFSSYLLSVYELDYYSPSVAWLFTCVYVSSLEMCIRSPTPHHRSYHTTHIHTHTHTHTLYRDDRPQRYDD
jgi:hypothetical protein